MPSPSAKKLAADMELSSEQKPAARASSAPPEVSDPGPAASSGPRAATPASDAPSKAKEDNDVATVDVFTGRDTSHSAKKRKVSSANRRKNTETVYTATTYDGDDELSESPVKRKVSVSVQTTAGSSTETDSDPKPDKGKGKENVPPPKTPPSANDTGDTDQSDVELNGNGNTNNTEEVNMPGPSTVAQETPATLAISATTIAADDVLASATPQVQLALPLRGGPPLSPVLVCQPAPTPARAELPVTIPPPVEAPPPAPAAPMLALPPAELETGPAAPVLAVAPVEATPADNEGGPAETSAALMSDEEVDAMLQSFHGGTDTNFALIPDTSFTAIDLDGDLQLILLDGPDEPLHVFRVQAALLSNASTAWKSLVDQWLAARAGAAPFDALYVNLLGRRAAANEIDDGGSDAWGNWANRFQSELDSLSVMARRFVGVYHRPAVTQAKYEAALHLVALAQEICAAVTSDADTGNTESARSRTDDSASGSVFSTASSITENFRAQLAMMQTAMRTVLDENPDAVAAAQAETAANEASASEDDSSTDDNKSPQVVGIDLPFPWPAEFFAYVRTVEQHLCCDDHEFVPRDFLEEVYLGGRIIINVRGLFSGPKANVFKPAMTLMLQVVHGNAPQIPHPVGDQDLAMLLQLTFQLGMGPVMQAILQPLVRAFWLREVAERGIGHKAYTTMRSLQHACDLGDTRRHPQERTTAERLRLPATIIAKMDVYWFVGDQLAFEMCLRQAAWQAAMNPNDIYDPVYRLMLDMTINRPPTASLVLRDPIYEHVGTVRYDLLDRIVDEVNKAIATQWRTIQARGRLGTRCLVDNSTDPRACDIAHLRAICHVLRLPASAAAATSDEPPILNIVAATWVDSPWALVTHLDHLSDGIGQHVQRCLDDKDSGIGCRLAADRVLGTGRSRFRRARQHAMKHIRLCCPLREATAKMHRLLSESLAFPPSTAYPQTVITSKMASALKVHRKTMRLHCQPESE